MRPKGPSHRLEKRRRRAVELSRQGSSIRAIARQLHASPGAVHRWICDWKKGGDRALTAKTSSGRPRKLTEQQHQELKSLLLAEANADDLRTEHWTLEKITTLVRDRFGVTYHPSHLWRVIQAFGWRFKTPQKKPIPYNDKETKKLIQNLRTHFPQFKWPRENRLHKTWMPIKPRVP